MESSIKGSGKENTIPPFQLKINQFLRENIKIEDFLPEELSMKSKNTTRIKCHNCGSENIYVESKQTRSADETTTKIYECLDCGNKWSVF